MNAKQETTLAATRKHLKKFGLAGKKKVGPRPGAGVEIQKKALSKTDQGPSGKKQKIFLHPIEGGPGDGCVRVPKY